MLYRWELELPDPGASHSNGDQNVSQSHDSQSQKCAARIFSLPISVTIQTIWHLKTPGSLMVYNTLQINTLKSREEIAGFLPVSVYIVPDLQMGPKYTELNYIWWKKRVTVTSREDGSRSRGRADDPSTLLWDISQGCTWRIFMYPASIVYRPSPLKRIGGGVDDPSTLVFLWEIS
jgi:hypothetical protein